MESNQIVTHLFIASSKEQLQNTVLGFLQRKLCPFHKLTVGFETLSCMSIDCRKLKHREHHAAYWFSPNKATYLVEDLTIIFEMIHLTRDPANPCFFIIEQAELLSATCANKLLKILEEPAPGYSFLLTTTHPNKVLPTILSRSITHSDYSTYHEHEHPLIAFFFPEPKLEQPFEFEQILKTSELTTTTAEELVHALYGNYLQLLIKTQKSEQNREKMQYYILIVDFLKQILLKPPASGSAELFFKKIYLTFPRNS